MGGPEGTLICSLKQKDSSTSSALKTVSDKYDQRTVSIDTKGMYTAQWFRPKQAMTKIVNTSGAGDTLVGTMGWARVYGGYSLIDAVLLGMEGACITLDSELPVAPNLRENLFALFHCHSRL